MRNHRTCSIALSGLAFIMLALVGCKTSPKIKADAPVVLIEKASIEEIRKYGPTYESNPYLEPRTLIRGKLNEFFVVKVSLNLATKSRVTVICDMKAPDGSTAGKAYSKDDFRAFWQQVIVQDQKSEDYKTKITTIGRSCIPSFDFTEGAGLTTYYLPFVGKNPMPRPSKVYVQVSVSGQGEPYVFTYDLVEPPAK